MLRVTIDVNGNEIATIHAVRVEGDVGEVCTYKLFDEEMIPFDMIKHQYNNGAEALAVLMIKSYNNDKKNRMMRKILDIKQMKFGVIEKKGVIQSE